MPIAVGAHRGQQFQTNATSHTTSGDTTQASGSTFVVFVVAGSGAGSIDSVSDNKGNTYTQIGSTITSSSGSKSGLFSCQNGTGGAGHTWTAVIANAEVKNIYAVEITGGLLSGILDQAPAGVEDASSPFTSNVTSTTAQANELLLAFVATDTPSGTETITWGNSFTQLDANGDSNFVTGGSAYRIVSATGAFSTSITSDVATSAVSLIAAFKEAGGTANASGAGATDAASAPAGSAAQQTSVTLTFKNAAGVAYTAPSKFWTRQSIAGAAIDGGSGGISATPDSGGVVILSGLTIPAGPGWVSFKETADDLNCHNYPVTFV